jgi:transposase-like protein
MFKGRHFDRSVILLCVRWYLAYSLSLRNLEEMMSERGISVDHATVSCRTMHYAPLLQEQFNRHKRLVMAKWHVDETYIKVRGQWRYLYRAIDSNGDTVEFWFSEWRNLAAAKRFLRKAIKERSGRLTSLPACAGGFRSGSDLRSSPARSQSAGRLMSWRQRR